MKITIPAARNAECTTITLDTVDNRVYEIAPYAHVRIIHRLFDVSDAAQMISFTVGQGADLEYVLLLTGTKKYSLDLTAALIGEHASATIIGAYALSGDAQVTINTKQMHNAANTDSILKMNGILTDNAYVSYKGLIAIDSQGMYTNAAQENKTIVLTRTARADSIPSIEVLQHKVRCSHGSAVGQLDEEISRYLFSRGFDVLSARELLVHAFFMQYLPEYMMHDVSGLMKNMLMSTQEP